MLFFCDGFTTRLPSSDYVIKYDGKSQLEQQSSGAVVKQGGEWGVESGKWKVEGGRWKVEGKKVTR
jgi:hypothetical protein